MFPSSRNRNLVLCRNWAREVSEMSCSTGPTLALVWPFLHVSRVHLARESGVLSAFFEYS